MVKKLIPYITISRKKDSALFDIKYFPILPLKNGAPVIPRIPRMVHTPTNGVLLNTPRISESFLVLY